MYDYLIVGNGLFGCTFAHEMHKRGKSVRVLERRSHVGSRKSVEAVLHLEGGTLGIR